jgi:capsular exopolysaccharide synthesis family protein
MPFQKNELHLLDLMATLRKYRRVVLSFFLVVFGLVVLVTYAATPLYEGTTKVLIEKVEGETLTGRVRGGSSDPEFYETQLQLIRSRAVVGRVVDLLNLEENYDSYLDAVNKRRTVLQFVWQTFGDVLGDIKSALMSGKRSANTEHGRKAILVEKIKESLIVRPMEGTRLVTISYFSPNPELAAMVANTIAKAYIEETLQLKMDATRRNLEWMGRKAEDEALKLKKSEQALQDYMKANDIITMEDRIAVVPEKLSEITVQLLRAETHRKELEILVRKINQAGRNYDRAETLTAVSSDLALQSLRAQIVEIEKNIMELSNKYGARHPLMVKARGDLQVLERKKRQEIDRIVASLRNEYELALSNEQTLRGKLTGAKSEALGLNEKFIQYGALKRVVDTNRTLYDALMLKLKEQSITEETNPVNLWLVEEANPPKVPAKPWKKANLILGLVAGLVGGIVLAFTLDYMDNTIKNPEEAESVLGVPILGVMAKRRHIKYDVEETVLRDPQSSFAESYRGLRTAVFLSFADQAPRRILITSAGMGEGKTTTSINLAMTFAQSDKKVLLIDADLRKPRVHNVFKIPNNCGLSNYLAGAVDGHIVQKTHVKNLFAITAGPIPPNPSELLISSRLPGLMDTMSSEFDVIVCDSPPVLPVSDARLLCRLFEGVIMVTAGGKTTYEFANRALRAIRDTGSRILGLVINAIDIDKTSYYHHSYYHHYGGEKKDKTPAPEAGKPS